MFNYDLSDTQLREIKQLLARYFQGKIDSEMDELWDKKGWSDAQMDSWAKEHMRKKK